MNSTLRLVALFALVFAAAGVDLPNKIDGKCLTAPAAQRSIPPATALDGSRLLPAGGAGWLAALRLWPLTPAASCSAGMETTYEVLAEGDGQAVSAGDTVTVHATGIVKETGKKFWSTKDAGQSPFTYKAGVNGVIKGWDQGCLGMKLGATRKLDIPAAEGYGAGGFPAWGSKFASHLRLLVICWSFLTECVRVQSRPTADCSSRSSS